MIIVQNICLFFFLLNLLYHFILTRGRHNTINNFRYLFKDSNSSLNPSMQCTSTGLTEMSPKIFSIRHPAVWNILVTYTVIIQETSIRSKKIHPMRTRSCSLPYTVWSELVQGEDQYTRQCPTLLLYTSVRTSITNAMDEYKPLFHTFTGSTVQNSLIKDI